MERNRGLLLALFAGIEPMILGIVYDRQWLTYIGLGNLVVILLYSYSTRTHKQPSAGHKVFSQYRPSHLGDADNHATYFGAISFISVIGGILSYILGGHDTLGNLALGLTTAGVVYWIAAIATHGIKKTWRSKISKLFALLIVAGAGWVVLGSSNGQSIIDDIPQLFHNAFSIPKAIAPETGETSPGDTNSGDTTGITFTGNNDNDTTSGSISETNTTGTTIGVDTSGQTSEQTPSETPKDTNTANPEKNNKTALTYAQVVPAIVQKYGLTASGPNVKFANITQTSNLYTPFKAGYNNRFFGLSINPNGIVSCNVYFVMLGLAQKRQVSYTSSTIFSAYATAAASHNQTYGCVSGKNVTEANLPW